MGDDNEAVRLELARLNERIDRLLEQGPKAETTHFDKIEPTHGNLEHWRFADRQLRIRELRHELFHGGTGEGGCWNIILYLARSQLENRGVSVTAAASASARPPTTGLRCIELLLREELVDRSGDPTDKRRAWLILTKIAWTKLEAYWAKVEMIEREETKRVPTVL